MKISFTTSLSNRKGFVLFVVLGTIFVLGVLVFSYNFLIRGKYREGKEIIKHIYASKCAQSINNYIIAQIKYDMAQPINGGVNNGRSSQNYRNSLFPHSDLTKLGEYFNGPAENLGKILLDIENNDKLKKAPVFEVESKTDGKQLKDALPNPLPDVFFLNEEKIGNLAIITTVKIVDETQTTETYYDKRPYKIVFPYPIPLTKFSFLMADPYTQQSYGEDDSLSSTNNYCYGLNTIDIKSSNGEASNKKPLIIDNGSDLTDGDWKDLWRLRGWIYIGNDKTYQLILNRAYGAKKYGQNWYSFADEPGKSRLVTMDFKFRIPNAPNAPNMPGGLGGPGGGPAIQFTPNPPPTLSIKQCDYGFYEGMFNNGSLWNEAFENSKNKEQLFIESKSSCLHLFSNKNKLLQNTSNLKPSITRVIGNVKDRCIDIRYLANDLEELYGVIKNYRLGKATVFLSDDEKRHLSSYFYGGKFWNQGSDKNDIRNYNGIELPMFEKFLCLTPSSWSNGNGLDGLYKSLSVDNNNSQRPDYFFINDFFSECVAHYSDRKDKNINDKVYSKIMSQEKFQNYDKVYNRIGIFLPGNTVTEIDLSSSNNDIRNFGDSSSDKPEETDFIPTNSGLTYKEIEGLSLDDKKMKYILELKKDNFGLNARTCYDLGNTDDLYEFKLDEDSNEINLCNLVYDIKSENVVLDKKITGVTGGAIISDSPINIECDTNSDLDNDIPITILSANEQEAIKVKEGLKISSYLVALNGKINFGESGETHIKGGVAMKTIDPNITSGILEYDYKNLDFYFNEKNEYIKYLGFVLGPTGEEP